MPSRITIRITVNGTPCTREVEARTTLVDFMRDAASRPMRRARWRS